MCRRELSSGVQVALMYSHGSWPDESLQGGLLLVRPSLSLLKGMTRMLRTGDFRDDGSGWMVRDPP